MPARNQIWEMRDEHSERDLWWKIENRKWIYYDIRKTRKLWKPKGAGEGEDCGASANENEANEINFSKSPTTQKQKENRSDLTNMLPVLTRTPAHKKQKERESDGAKEREAVQESESAHSLTRWSSSLALYGTFGLWQLLRATSGRTEPIDDRHARSCRTALSFSLSLSLALCKGVGPPMPRIYF